MTNYKFHNDLKQLSGHVYENGEFEIPAGWEKVESSPPSKSGMQAAVYVNSSTNDLVVAYRGTEPDKKDEKWKDFKADAIMFLNSQISAQYIEALLFYHNVKKNPKYRGMNVTVTGHSLGGSLAQIVSAQNGCPAVTFNAYGTGDVLKKHFNKKNLNNLNIINYANIYDPIFRLNYKAQPGKSYLVPSKLSTSSGRIKKYHFLSGLDKLSKSREIKPGEPLPPVPKEEEEFKMPEKSEIYKKNMSGPNKSIKRPQSNVLGFASPVNETSVSSRTPLSNLSNPKVQEKTEHKEKTKPTSSSKKDSDKDGKWVTIKGHPVFIEDSSPVHIVKNCYVEDMLPAKIIKSSFAQDCIDLRGTIRRVLCE